MRFRWIILLVVIGSLSINPSNAFVIERSDVNLPQINITNATYISVVLSNIPTEVDDGSAVNISVAFTTDDLNGSLVDLALETTAGTFENNQSMISFQFAAENKTIFVTWYAPILYEQDIDATISARAVLDELEDTDSKQVHVKMIFFDFEATWITLDKYYQNKTAPITLRVTQGSKPIEGAMVGFALEVGKFVESKTDSVNIETNSSGYATAFIDFSGQEFLFEETNIEISAVVTKPKFNELLVNTTITVIKSALIPMVTIDFSKGEDNGHPFAIFAINATLSGRPWINATFKIVATGGTFENGESQIFVKTNASGLVTVKWTADGIPQTKDDIVVFFTVDLTSIEYGTIDQMSYNLTIAGTNPVQNLPSSLTTGNSAPLFVLPWILVVPQIRRRKK